MKVAILCGGAGTRIQEAGPSPKPMLQIGGKPIIWHIMKIFAHAGFSEFVLCLGYKGEVIKDYFLNYNYRQNDFTVNLGKSGSVQLHESGPSEDWTVTLADTGLSSETGERVAAIKKYLDVDRFFLTYGDGVADIDVRNVLDTHVRSGRLATVTGVRPSSRFGELSIEDGAVSSFREKPQVGTGWINGGFLVLERAALDLFHPKVGSLEDGVLVDLAKRGELAVHLHDGFWQCMDTVREMRLLEDLWRSGGAPWAVWRT